MNSSAGDLDGLVQVLPFYAYLAAANGPSVDAENHAIQLMFGPLVVGLFFCSNLSSEQVFSLLPKQQNAPEDKVAVLRVL